VWGVAEDGNYYIHAINQFSYQPLGENGTEMMSFAKSGRGTVVATTGERVDGSDGGIGWMYG
jgi:hypothetical protein